MTDKHAPAARHAPEHAYEFWDVADQQALDGLTASKLLFSGRCVLMGWAIANTGGSAQTIEIYDGQDTGGTPTAAVTITNGQSSVAWFGDKGIGMDIGCFAVIPAAGFKGAVFVKSHKP